MTLRRDDESGQLYITPGDIACIFPVFWSTQLFVSLGHVWVHVEPSLNGDGQPPPRLCQKLGIYRYRQGFSGRYGWDEGATLTDIGVYDRFVFICLGEDLATACKKRLASADMKM
jgi:hypothetical protein